MARARRIVCYAVNGSGLGHVTRLLATARWLRRYATFLDGAPPEIFFLTSTEATALLAEAGFPAFKLPSKTVVRQAGHDLQEFRRLARHFVWHTLGVFAPDLLVVDTFPAGSYDELFQLLDGPGKKAFIQRQVKPEFARRPVFAAALGLYDLIVVPHATLGEPAGGGPAPATGPPRLACGEVLQLERAEARARDEVRAELGVAPGDRLVYLSAGGGGDPDAESVLTGLVEALRDLPGLHLLVGCGPLYHGRRPAGRTVSWSSDPGLARAFAACDAALAAAGYNTFHELLYFGVPTLFFAQEKIADDQRRRIEAAAARGACRLLPDPGDAAAVRAALTALLQPATQAALSAAARALVPDNGAARCAALLLQPLYGEAALAHAAATLTPELVHRLERGRSVERANALIGKLLPRLFPLGAAGAGAPGSATELAVPALEALLHELTPAAADEVRQALSRRPEQAERQALLQALLALLQQAEAADVEPERLAGLLELAMKKQPLAQETDRRYLPWVAGLCRQLAGLLAEPASPPWDRETTLQLYRAFPRLHDCDGSTAGALLQRLLAEARAAGRQPPTVLRALQAVKLLHRTVHAAQLAPLLEGRQG